MSHFFSEIIFISIPEQQDISVYDFTPSKFGAFFFIIIIIIIIYS